MRRSKRRKTMIINHLTARQPPQGWLILRAPADLSGRAHPSAISINPHTDQYSRIPSRTASLTLQRVDRALKGTQIQLPDKLPDRSGRMILFYQLLHIDR